MKGKCSVSHGVKIVQGKGRQRGLLEGYHSCPGEALMAGLQSSSDSKGSILDVSYPYHCQDGLHKETERSEIEVGTRSLVSMPGKSVLFHQGYYVVQLQGGGCHAACKKGVPRAYREHWEP